MASNLLVTLKRNAQVYTTSADGGHYQHIDFISYYMAGSLAAQDRETRLKAYDPAVQMEYYNKAIAPAEIDRTIFFNYPPYAFPLMTIFSFLPLRAAYLVWNALALGAAAVALFLAGRAAQRLNAFALCGVIAMFVLSFPGCDALMDGQTTWWFVALIALSYWGLKTDRNVLAGIATGLLAFKPHYYLFMLIPVLVSKKKAAIFAALGTLAALIAIAALTMGFDSVINYPRVVVAGENPALCPMTFPERMVCLRGPASIFLSHDWYMRLAFASFAVGLGAVALTFRQVFSPASKLAASLEWAYALTIPLILTLSPHMHIYDCALLAIPACLLLTDIRPSKLLQTKNIPLLLSSVLLCSYMLVSWLMMVLPPEIGKAILDPATQSKLSINNITCALLSFHSYLIFDVILIALLILQRLNEILHVRRNPEGA